jgi:F-type H+-transporting ATPase subunit delta
MKARRTRISQVIADKTLKQGVSRRYSREVAAYLLSERRTGQLDSIMRDVQGDWAQAGFVEVLASSAHPLSAAVKKDIAARIRRLHPKARQVIVTEIRDPEVIGGVRLNLADQQLDLSVQAKLNKFKQLTTGSGNLERK